MLPRALPARWPLLLAACVVLLAVACDATAPRLTSTPTASTPGAPSATGTMPNITPSTRPSPTASPTPTPTPSPTPTPTPSPTPTPPSITGTLELEGPGGRVPADGRSVATLTARVSLAGGAPPLDRHVSLRPLEPTSEAAARDPVQRVDEDGELAFEVTASRAGRFAFGLFDDSGWSGDAPLATVEVEFSRKVVVLVPGFQSALARRYLTFGEPRNCAQPADPRSITEALMCLGYEPDVTILDMAWEAAPCRPADAAQSPPRAECVATISPTDDGSDVRWQPADYDLADLGLSMLRQQQVDLWGHRLARTMVAYDEELLATTGTRASFYLVGHSMGGQVVVRALRAMLNDPQLRVSFEGQNRGLLHAVVSVDGALNWDGTVALIGQPRCGMPVRTVADEARAHDNADAVAAAYEAFGTLTVAMTSATDPIVTPDVALLRNPPPSQGYVEAIYHEGMFDEGCSHSALLWPEPTGYPLRDVFEEHIGPAAAD